MSKFSYMRTWILNLKVTFRETFKPQIGNIRINVDNEINIYIEEAFKETDENYNDDLTPTYKSTGSEKIPKDNCYALIEPDLLDNFDENMNDNNRVSNDAGGGEDDNKDGKGYYNYNVDDLLYSTNEEEKD
ncbi:hypothetical protein RhiirC2_797414 [Rhizophagus irregularis]|uniref:Uncharacterized protein n=1 Tax=Rhizophagus irregularis TaxID=588596 RepID=A0A2N1M828_9GLOM|nr:hypothetical protein RhiirC2_797414 [Rhizophagus irregularis]